MKIAARAAFTACSDLIHSVQLLLEHFALLALLVGNAAGSLASRLARSLAFAAAALLGRFCKISGFKSLNSFHVVHLLSKNDMNTSIVYQFRSILSSKAQKNIPVGFVRICRLRRHGFFRKMKYACCCRRKKRKNRRYLLDGQYDVFLNT